MLCKAVIIVMNKTAIPRHDQHAHPNHTKKDKHKDETALFEVYHSSNLRIKEAAVHTSSVMIVKGNKQADLVRKVL